MNKNLARIVSTEKYNWIKVNLLEDTFIKGKLQGKINLFEDSMDNSGRIIIMILRKKGETYSKNKSILDKGEYASKKKTLDLKNSIRIYYGKDPNSSVLLELKDSAQTLRVVNLLITLSIIVFALICCYLAIRMCYRNTGVQQVSGRDKYPESIQNPYLNPGSGKGP